MDREVTTPALQSIQRYMIVGMFIAAFVMFGVAFVMVVTRGWASTILILAGTPAVGLIVSYVAFERGSHWIDFMLPGVVTNLLGIGAANTTLGRWRRASDCLTQDVLELEPSILVAGRVDVGNVAANRVHPGLVVVQTRHGRPD